MPPPLLAERSGARRHRSRARPPYTAPVMRNRVGPILLGLLLVSCGTPNGSPSQGAIPSAGGAPSIGASPSVLPTPEPVVGDGEEWLAYQWIDATGDGIYLARPDGSGQHQILTDLAGSEIHPDWSPDGQRLAFVRITPEDQSELWVVNADGTGEELLYSCEDPCNSIGYPDWNADGTRHLLRPGRGCAGQRDPSHLPGGAAGSGDGPGGDRAHPPGRHDRGAAAHLTGRDAAGLHALQGSRRAAGWVGHLRQ